MSTNRSTIQAKVNPRLLVKAQRLFTGTLAGRITEVLQNARRAGATQVCISNADGTLVTVRDDGRGIDDFSILLDLGGSGWDRDCESAEDPAGVGLFCLAPRELTVRSNGQVATIDRAGWAGAEAVEVLRDERGLPAVGKIRKGVGTELRFVDAPPWTAEAVTPLAVFSGMDVVVDGEHCPREPFLSGESTHYPELGCRVQVLRHVDLPSWHQKVGGSYGENVHLNFHGQIVAFAYDPADQRDLQFLVDFTGEPTAIRLMLPGRTRVVENDALKQLKAVLEREAYLFLQRQGHHRLYYRQYLRARELGIELPEAELVYRVGLLTSGGMDPEPVEVTMPQGHLLARCYRAGDALPDDGDEANVHLLAALGKLSEPFVVVQIDVRYDGYGWAKLPTVDAVEVTASAPARAQSWFGGGTLTCVDAITLTARCSDGRTFSSAVCMAIKPPPEGKDCYDTELHVTPQARQALNAEQIWYHLGGYGDDGDTYDTQLYEFRKELDAFWAKVVGPHEPMRGKLMECLADLTPGWESVTMLPDGRVTIRHADGSEQIVEPPARESGEAASNAGA